MSAAAELTDAVSVSDPTLEPSGIPVRSGRVHLGRHRQWLPTEGPLAVVAGFATACWLGAPSQHRPSLGRLTFRDTARTDTRGRVVLGRQARAWLAVADPSLFEAVMMPAPGGGLLVVPVEDFGRRFEAVSP